MKRTRYFALASLGSIALLQNVALAQDLSVPQPNVMLLVDTSGSMEYQTSSSDFPACDPTSSDEDDNQRSRWVGLVEVLSGTITDYRCEAVDRRSSAFRNEYQLDNTIDPADFQYQNPYHRPLSGTCAMGPGTLNTTNAFAWSEPECHAYDNVNNACAATACESFRQSGDGIIDAYGSGVRFGLMTFDSLIDEARGYSGTSPQLSAGVEGAWSYYVDSAAKGKPANCKATSPYEVGGRNAAAPPWEGRMVAFGDPSPELSDHATRNSQIEKILLTTRPYGATPVAGLLSDALGFFTEDEDDDPLNTNLKFGPKDDPYVLGGCRSQHVILLTDGEPNLDLRPYCTEEPGDSGLVGVCPYPETDEIAKELYDAGVTVHVIGFALDEVEIDGESVNCSDIKTDVLLGSDGTSGLCADDLTNNKPLAVCCELSTIAYRGSDGDYRAHFAGDTSALRKAFGEVLSAIAPRVSLTQPAVASGASATSDFAASMRFYSAARPESFSVWRAELKRERYLCDGDQPKVQDISAALGDDFVENLHTNRGAGRNIVTVEAEADASDSTKVRSERSIRPHIVGSAQDGLDSLSWDGGDEVVASPSQLAGAVEARTLGLDLADPSCNDLDEGECAEQILNWLVGQNPTDDENHRCRSTSECSLMGAIVHSTPQVVGRPDALILDESYDAFKLTYATRPLVLYTSTNDGFLHAFKVASGDPTTETTPEQQVKTKTQNELWAFIPPAALTGLQTQYPGSHQILLDGVPVIKDVVAAPSNVPLFERDADSARFGASLWRTVLVQAFGGTRGGYFALDITDPVISGDTGGPRFLWQLTTDSEGNPLFGEGGGTPLITTAFLDNKEVAVAVLPGGEGTRDDGADPVDREAVTTFVDADYTPRAKVPAYSGAAARSLTIVRLDNGEIVRTFRNDADEVDDLASDVVTETGIDSPITGTPVAYPAEVGAIADRVFVGDQEGALWRIDLSEPNPDDWTMTLFYDAFPEQTANGALSFDPEDGQPIATRPIISVDSDNRLVVLFSTGDQESMFASDTDNFIVSLTEVVDTVDGVDTFKSKVNWYLEFHDGERVTGPMVLFSGQLYAASFQGAPASSVCGGGKSRVWAMDFVERKTESDPAAGGTPLWNLNGTLAQWRPVTDKNGKETVVFGLTLAQEPSCIDTSLDDLAEDPFIAFGTHTQLRGLNPGKFKLIMHTGSLDSGSVSATPNTQEIELETPTSIARIDSWASIVE